MKSNFNEDFFASVREVAVWGLLSEDRDFIWSEKLIDQYKDKIDWKKLSGNSNVQWTSSMIEKYKDKIDWNEFSNGSSKYLYTAENLRKFSSKWNWSELSSNSSVNWTPEMIEEFKDSIDWDSIINCYRRDEDLYTLDFFEKFKEYFPVSSLQNSRLWDNIVEIYKDKLIVDILSHE